MEIIYNVLSHNDITANHVQQRPLSVSGLCDVQHQLGKCYYLLKDAYFNHTSENKSCSNELNKTPTADKIHAELLNYGANKVINGIYNSITLIWEQEQIMMNKRNLSHP